MVMCDLKHGHMRLSVRNYTLMSTALSPKEHGNMLHKHVTTSSYDCRSDAGCGSGRQKEGLRMTSDREVARWASPHLFTALDLPENTFEFRKYSYISLSKTIYRSLFQVCAFYYSSHTMKLT